MTKRDSNILKGLAAVFMLIHHLDFSNVQDVAVMIQNPFIHDMWAFLTVVCKVCVAIFVFVTGYGTTKSMQEGNNQQHMSSPPNTPSPHWSAVKNKP